jgi:hypothetical protein
MARGGARPGAGRKAAKSANTSPVSRGRAHAREAAGNQKPWPADKVERWAIDRLIPMPKMHGPTRMPRSRRSRRAELERGADPLPVVHYDDDAGERSLDIMRWGLVPFWAKDIKIGYSTFNARAEEIWWARTAG